MRDVNALKAEIAASASEPVVAYAKASMPASDGQAALTTADANQANGPATTDHGSNSAGWSPAIVTSPATGAGQMSGTGTPNSPNDGSGTMPGSANGPGR
jgi:hypothetical protein